FGGKAWAAIYVGDKASFGKMPKFRYNNLSGNGWGVLNASKELIDATLNWWGDACGPNDNSDDSPQPYLAYNPNPAGRNVSNMVMYCPNWDAFPNGNPAGACLEPVADFEATPLEGFAPLTVKFTDLSYCGVTDWLWDFGDGTTSTEQNPTHVYDPPVDPKFTVSLTVTNYGGTKTITKEKYIEVWLPIVADFDAEPTVGYGPLNVQFENKCTGTHRTYLWDFGDGTTSEGRNPLHCYEEPGVYTVTLHAKGPQDEDTITIEQLIEVYDQYEQPGLTDLVLMDASADWSDAEGWSNAIDRDTYGRTGACNAGKEMPWAIFGFEDELDHEINKVRMMTDTGEKKKINDWVKEFTVMVSTTGTEDADFASVGTFENVGGGWNEFTFDPVNANYVKLVIDEPHSGWRQIGEFEVYDNVLMPDVTGTTLMATSPHYANGVDEAAVTINVADSTGIPVSGLPPNAFHIKVSGCCTEVSEVTETDEAGTYTATITATEAGDRTVVAYVYGKIVEYSSLVDEIPVVISFIEPELTAASLQVVTGTDCWHKEGWDKAVDGDTISYTSAGVKWKDSYGIYEFTDQETKTIQKYRILIDCGNGWRWHWVTEIEVWISTTGIEDDDFTLLQRRSLTTTDWSEFSFEPVEAKYIKLRPLQPKHTWRQITEFEVYTMPDMFGGPQIANAESELSAVKPTVYALHQNFPNPFNPETTIKYQLPEPSDVKLEVYNIRGQLIRTLINGSQSMGEHQIVWNGTDAHGATVVSGVYFYRISAVGETGEKFTVTKRMALLK
ncbi:PKD domain-containing protein, partial [candidate division KSB1 bacterium]|nr:PKD domain-containing protein [candidate division KSB1 bacterium]